MPSTINIYSATETSFSGTGLAVLDQCISCYTTEDLNGAYELSLEYPIDQAGKWKFLIENNIIQNTDGQRFRIFHRVKTLLGIKVTAQHIFYDLSANFIESVKVENVNGSGALNAILNGTQYAHPFDHVCDVGEIATQNFIKRNVIDAIMGAQYSILSTWGGELKRDNYTIGLYYSSGVDRGVVVSYGKNIVGFEETIDLSGLVTRILPFGKDDLLLPEKYVDSTRINKYPYPYIKPVSFSTATTVADLRTLAEKYFRMTRADIPTLNYRIDFIELTKTEEYKNFAILEKVDMGDTVTVNHELLDISVQLKVIHTKKNEITGRIEEIELGNFKQTLSDAIDGSVTNTGGGGGGGGNGSTGDGPGGVANPNPGEIHPKLYTSHNEPDPAIGIDGDVWIKY